MSDSWPPPPGGVPGPPWNPYAQQPAPRSGVPVWLIVLLSVFALLLVATVLVAAVLVVRTSGDEGSGGDARVGEVASPSASDSDDDGDDNGDDSGDAGESSDVSALETGDCFFEPDGDDDVVFEVRIIECSEPHESEVYLEFEVPSGKFPGDDKIGEIADNRCFEEFETYVGMDYDDSILDYTWLTPTAKSWTLGDREVTCAIYEMPEEEDGEPVLVTGSLRGAKR